MIRTILFDFGNVVGFFDHQRALAQVAAYTDVPAVELALRLYGSVIEDDYECGRLTTDEYVREAMLNGRLTCTPEQFRTFFCDIFWRNDEVCDLVPTLAKRYRLVLASNTNDAHFTKYSEMFADTLRHFAALGVSHRARARKPHREFFEHVHGLTDAEPGECVFVDDLPVNIEAAERFGWKGIVYRPDGMLAEKLRAAGVEVGG